MDNLTTNTTAIVPVTPGPETMTDDQHDMQEQEMVRAIMQTGNARFIAKVQSGKLSIPDAYQDWDTIFLFSRKGNIQCLHLSIILWLRASCFKCNG